VIFFARQLLACVTYKFLLLLYFWPGVLKARTINSKYIIKELLDNHGVIIIEFCEIVNKLHNANNGIHRYKKQKLPVIFKLFHQVALSKIGSINSIKQVIEKIINIPISESTGYNKVLIYFSGGDVYKRDKS
jgi:hypothetical protein